MDQQAGHSGYASRYATTFHVAHHYPVHRMCVGMSISLGLSWAIKTFLKRAYMVAPACPSVSRRRRHSGRSHRESAQSHLVFVLSLRTKADMSGLHQARNWTMLRIRRTVAITVWIWLAFAFRTTVFGHSGVRCPVPYGWRICCARSAKPTSDMTSAVLAVPCSSRLAPYTCVGPIGKRSPHLGDSCSDAPASGRHLSHLVFQRQRPKRDRSLGYGTSTHLSTSD